MNYDLTGADFINEAIELHCQPQALFGKVQFLLHKLNFSESSVVDYSKYTKGMYALNIIILQATQLVN